ncbi:tripartite tricarboxylate transporter permease [Clostridium boliviensis]|uniref:Tripartite tricarboxylate transporter permease n=2 Tax=Bacillota TaxID=1239 RepID=A0ABU4GNS6_9CLOT|nr:tripartite tricarboxylate transporter permease [Clostridium boliviensis]MDW2799278.1 tripartite tricarboxylate transporter permease [Clostridium boliviensis]
MNALISLGSAYARIFTPSSLMLMAAGVTVGIIFGSIPGLSASMAVALFLPLTFSMSPSMGMNMLVAVYIGGISGGLISAILLNMPGTASSIATCFDGHPMAKNGEAGKALGYGIVFSFIGSIFSFIVLTFCAPLLADIALKFTPAENFGISFFALTMVAVLASGSMVKGVLAGMLGLIFALVGMAPIDGTARFTFGSSSLMAGFDTLPTLIGIFAISEILITAESMGNGALDVIRMKPIKGFGFSWKDFIYQIPNAIRSALIGTGIGILPGIGGSTSGMLSYVTAKNMSKHPEEFGKGCPDGIVATETANNATIGGAMIPLLVLGIPGDGVTAMMLGGFLIHGLSAGPLLFVKNADVVYGIFAACMICVTLMLLIEFFGIRVFVQLLKIPKHILMPLILVLCCVGAYATNNRIFDVQSIILFGLVGYLYHKFRLPTTPFVLCFLIGKMLETYLRRGIMQYKSFGAFFQRPIFDAFFFVAIGVVVWTVYKEYKMYLNKKGVKAAEQS